MMKSRDKLSALWPACSEKEDIIMQYFEKLNPLVLQMELPTPRLSSRWFSFPALCALLFHTLHESRKGKNSMSVYIKPLSTQENGGWLFWLGRPLGVHLISHESWRWLAAGRKDAGSVFNLMSVLMMRPGRCNWGLGVSQCLFLFTPQLSWRLNRTLFFFKLRLQVSPPSEVGLQCRYIYGLPRQPDIIMLALLLLELLMPVCF